MWSQQLSVPHQTIHWYQKFTLHNVFPFEKLLTCRSCTKFFLRNTNYTDRNGVDKQKTHTKHLEKDNVETGGPTINMDAFEFLVFDSAREASNDVNTFLNFRFVKKQKTAGFFLFEKVSYANKLKVKKVSLMYLNFCRK